MSSAYVYHYPCHIMAATAFISPALQRRPFRNREFSRAGSYAYALFFDDKEPYTWPLSISFDAVIPTSHAAAITTSYATASPTSACRLWESQPNRSRGVSIELDSPHQTRLASRLGNTGLTCPSRQPTGSGTFVSPFR